MTHTFNYPNKLVTNMVRIQHPSPTSLALIKNESLLIGDEINKMGATPSYYEAVKICNGSLHSPRVNTMSKDIFKGNRMVRAFYKQLRRHFFLLTVASPIGNFFAKVP